MPDGPAVQMHQLHELLHQAYDKGRADERERTLAVVRDEAARWRDSSIYGYVAASLDALSGLLADAPERPETPGGEA